MSSPQQVPYLDGTLHIPDKFLSSTFIRSTDNLDGTKIVNQTVATGPSNGVGFIKYDTTNSVYPPRPTARTDVMFFWVGPIAPIIGNTYALDNTDQWINTSP